MTLLQSHLYHKIFLLIFPFFLLMLIPLFIEVDHQTSSNAIEAASLNTIKKPVAPKVSNLLGFIFIISAGKLKAELLKEKWITQQNDPLFI